VVEHSLGKGEVDSSILSGSTTKALINRHFSANQLPFRPSLNPEQTVKFPQKLRENQGKVFTESLGRGQPIYQEKVRHGDKLGWPNQVSSKEVSNWEVETKSAVDLMVATSAAIAADPKFSYGEALQKSMLAMIDNAQHPEWADPRFWAPFVVVGEPASALIGERNGRVTMNLGQSRNEFQEMSSQGLGLLLPLDMLGDHAL
jgi:hypothetical protein